jgi:apolipoprotein N-acyltransferase
MNAGAPSPATPGAAGADRAALRPGRAHWLLAAAAGVLATLTFAPTPHGGWLALVVFAGVYALLARAPTPRDAALTLGLFSFANFVSGVYWLYISMHDYGEMPAALAAAAVVLFSLYLASYGALAALAWRALAGTSRSPWLRACVFASAWSLGEWLRGYVFTGFPWLACGYAQVDGPLAGWAPLVGVYGVGWTLACTAALTTEALCAPRRRLAPGAGAAAFVFAGLALSAVSWTAPVAGLLNVRLLQGNVAQSLKFEQAGVNASLDLYRRLITAAPADLVVTPETALPVVAEQMPQDVASAIRDHADRTGTAVLLGVLSTVRLPGDQTGYTNTVIGVTPRADGLFRYDKFHLVPFGEFVPWGFRWFVNYMNIPLGDLARGAPVQPPFVVRGHRVAVDVCYEDIFGEEIARTLRGQQPAATILVNATNLAWFGNTIALDQHLQIARMRALETGRPVLRATNTGATAAIDAQGRVTGRLRAFTTGVLDARVQGMAGATPYICFGNDTVVGLSAALLACAWFARARRRQ